MILLLLRIGPPGNTVNYTAASADEPLGGN